MKADMKIPWDARVLRSFGMGNTSFADYCNNTETYWNKWAAACEIRGRWHELNCGPVSQAATWLNGQHSGSHASDRELKTWQPPPPKKKTLLFWFFFCIKTHTHKNSFEQCFFPWLPAELPCHSAPHCKAMKCRLCVKPKNVTHSLQLVKQCLLCSTPKGYLHRCLVMAVGVMPDVHVWQVWSSFWIKCSAD